METETEDGKDERKDSTGHVDWNLEPKTYRKSQGKQVKVQCGFKGCTAKPMLLQNLKDHTRVKHGSSHPCVKGQNTMSSYFGLGVSGKTAAVKEVGPRDVDKDDHGSVISDLQGSFDETEEVDINANEEEGAKEQDRKRGKEEIRKIVEEGKVTKDTLNKFVIDNLWYDAVFELEEKAIQVRKMDKKELLCFAGILCSVEEFLEEMDDNMDKQLDKVNKCIEVTAKELQSERHNWENFKIDEIELMKQLVKRKPLLSVYLTKALIAALSQPGETVTTDENSNCIKEINKKLEKIVDKVTPNLDVSGCKTDKEIALKSLDAIQATVNVAADIRKLREAMDSFEETAGVKVKNIVESGAKMKTADESLTEARGVREITELIPEFEFRPEDSGKEFHCIVCHTTFSYGKELEQDFRNLIIMEDKFRSVKRSLRRHLQTSTHIIQGKAEEAKMILWTKEERRNRAVGLVLGRLVYYIIYKGRPDIDFPTLVYLSATGGSDCGDINHSFAFVLKFLPYLTGAVRRRLKKMLGTRLVGTGCLPPVGLMADKATHQRETRQVVGGITVNPGGEEFLVAVLFGIPKCAGGTGDDLADSILEAGEPFVDPIQVKLVCWSCF